MEKPSTASRKAAMRTESVSLEGPIGASHLNIGRTNIVLYVSATPDDAVIFSITRVCEDVYKQGHPKFSIVFF